MLAMRSHGVPASRDQHAGFPIDFLVWVEVAAEQVLLGYRNNPMMSPFQNASDLQIIMPSEEGIK